MKNLISGDLITFGIDSHIGSVVSADDTTVLILVVTGNEFETIPFLIRLNEKLVFRIPNKEIFYISCGRIKKYTEDGTLDRLLKELTFK